MTGTRLVQSRAMVPQEADACYRLLSTHASMDRRNFDLMLPAMDTVFVDAHACLLSAKTEPEFIYIIKQGLLRAAFVTAEGKEYSKEFYWEADTVFSMRYLITCQPLAYSVFAVEPCQLYRFPVKRYIEFIDQYPGWQRFHREQLENHLLHKEMKEALFLLHSNQEKVEEVYRLFPGFVKRVPATLLASYLGITPVSLSRIKKRLSIQ